MSPRLTFEPLDRDCAGLPLYAAVCALLQDRGWVRGSVDGARAGWYQRRPRKRADAAVCFSLTAALSHQLALEAQAHTQELVVEVAS